MGGAYKLFDIVSFKMTLNERISVLLYVAYLQGFCISKSGIGRGVLQHHKHPLNPPLAIYAIKCQQIVIELWLGTLRLAPIKFKNFQFQKRE